VAVAEATAAAVAVEDTVAEVTEISYLHYSSWGNCGILFYLQYKYQSPLLIDNVVVLYEECLYVRKC